MKKLIIIPAYNESANIEKTIKMIQENAPEFDYVIINDCSTDDTKKICEKNGYNYIDLPINLGIGGAVQTGYRYGYEEGYDMAVQVDGDGQHDPKFLATMANIFITSGLRMVNRDVMKIFAYDYPKDYPEPESVVAILRQKKNVEEIPVIMKAREGGVSSISPKKSVYYMIKVTLAILIERIRK